jgi:mRNA interferase RelE/StbE
LLYVVEITPAARRQLKRAAPELRERCRAAFGRLAEDPRHPGVKALTGGHVGRLRVRIGDDRIVFEVDDERRIVYIVGVGHRDRIY